MCVVWQEGRQKELAKQFECLSCMLSLTFIGSFTKAFYLVSRCGVVVVLCCACPGAACTFSCLSNTTLQVMLHSQHEEHLTPVTVLHVPSSVAGMLFQSPHGQPCKKEETWYCSGGLLHLHGQSTRHAELIIPTYVLLCIMCLQLGYEYPASCAYHMSMQLLQCKLPS